MSYPWPALTRAEWAEKLGMPATPKKRPAVVTLGDFEGHPFRGNQYTTGNALFSREAYEGTSVYSPEYRALLHEELAQGSAPPTNNAAVRKAEEQIRERFTEWVSVIGPDGKRIALLTDDKKDEVTIPDDLIPRMADAVFTHNHPVGSSFSPDDIKMAEIANVREMRAATLDGTFVLRRLGSSWPKDLSVEAMFTANEFKAEWTKDIEKGRLTVGQANSLHWHAVWRTLAGRHGDAVDYFFEKRPR